MNRSLLKKAVKIFGTQTALARACGVTQPAVFRWLNTGKGMRIENAFAIERVTEGKIKAIDLFPYAKDSKEDSSRS